MNKEAVLSAVSLMREVSKKRNFEQSVDFGMNFTGLDFKKPQNRIDVDVTLPNPAGKKADAKALVFVKDKVFAEQLKGKAKVILEQEIEEIKSKDVEKFLNEYDIFLAEGASILTVAKYLGQQLAPRGKMPRPITTDLKSFETALAKASTSVKVSNSKGKFMPLVHILVGKETDSDEKIAQNIVAVYNSVLNSMGGKKQHVKSGFVKLSMGPAIKIGLNKEETQALKKRIEEKNTKKRKSEKK